jgi:hypothetical protein
MIERCTITFAPAVGKKELEKALNEARHPDNLNKFLQVKARIERIGDIEDVKRCSELPKRACSLGCNLITPRCISPSRRGEI